MNFKRRIAPLISIFSLIGIAMSGSSLVATNHDLLSRGSSITSRKTLALATDLGYQEYFYGTSSTRGQRVVFDELYLSLEDDLIWAWRTAGLTKQTAISIKEAYESSLETASSFNGIFTSSTGTDLYSALETEFNASKQADGLSPVTDNMIPILNEIYYNLATKNKLYGSTKDCWDRFCYYKGHADTANPYDGDTAVGELKLVYGDESLKDEDAFVLLVMGDGFTSSDFSTFYSKSDSFADYMMATEPFSEYTDALKIYSMCLESNESGVTNDTSDEKKVDTAEFKKDTYFGSSFWCSGMQRLISVSTLGLLKMNSLVRYKLPLADYAGLIVNSTRYGGSGGTYCTCSLAEGEESTSYSTDAREIFIHEIAHTIANLADEYYAGTEYFGEHPNMSASQKVKDLPWADFIGVGGVNRYAYCDEYDEPITYRGSVWYKPTDGTCKMQLLGQDHPFCPVCTEALRKNISKDANVTSLSYQPYNRLFKKAEDNQLVIYRNGNIENVDNFDLTQYIYARKGSNQSLLSELDLSKTTIKYLDGDGVEVSSPSDIGTYTANVEFKGDQGYTAKNLSINFEITTYIPPKEEDEDPDDTSSSEPTSSEPTGPVTPTTPEDGVSGGTLVIAIAVSCVVSFGGSFGLFTLLNKRKKKLRRRL